MRGPHPAFAFGARGGRLVLDTLPAAGGSRRAPHAAAVRPGPDRAAPRGGEQQRSVGTARQAAVPADPGAEAFEVAGDHVVVVEGVPGTPALRRLAQAQGRATVAVAPGDLHGLRAHVYRRQAGVEADPPDPQVGVLAPPQPGRPQEPDPQCLAPVPGEPADDVRELLDRVVTRNAGRRHGPYGLVAVPGFVGASLRPGRRRVVGDADHRVVPRGQVALLPGGRAQGWTGTRRPGGTPGTRGDTRRPRPQPRSTSTSARSGRRAACSLPVYVRHPPACTQPLLAILVSHIPLWAVQRQVSSSWAATAAVAESGPGREHRDRVLVLQRLP